MLLQLVAVACGLCCIGISPVTADVLKTEVSSMQHNTPRTKEKCDRSPSLYFPCVVVEACFELEEWGGIKCILRAVGVTHGSKGECFIVFHLTTFLVLTGIHCAKEDLDGLLDAAYALICLTLTLTLWSSEYGANLYCFWTDKQSKILLR